MKTDKSAALEEAGKELKVAEGNNGNTKQTENRPAPKKKATPASKSEPTFTKTEVEQMFAKMSTELEKKLMGKVSNFGNVNRTDIGTEEIDPDDILPKDKAVTFFSHSQGKTIFDDVRYGKVSYPPYSEKRTDEAGVTRMVSNPYRFKRFFSQEAYDNNGRHKKKKWICICVVESKKRAEWLRNHSLFGIAFYEKLEHAVSVDAYLQDKLIEAYNYINTLSDTTIVQRCKNEGIQITTTDMSELKRTLVKHVTEKNMKLEKAKLDQIAINNKMLGFGIGKEKELPGMVVAH